MMLVAPNSSEDSQGTQLRIGKKLTTVCSGKRSRFSKPRPNLAISKRGESNVLANAGKTSKNHEIEVVQTSLSSNTDSKEKTLNGDIQNQLPIIDIDEKPFNEDIQHQLPIRDIKKKIVDDIKNVLPSEQVDKKTVEDGCEIVPYDDASKIIQEQSNQVIPSTNSEVLDSKVIEVFSDKVECQMSNAEKLSPHEELQIISNTDVEKISSDEDTPVISNIDFKKISSDKDIQVISNIDFKKPVSKENIQIKSNTNDINISKENDIQIFSPKTSGSPLKNFDSEKRNISNATPTIIDKSKYPHLTSILSKKRTEPRKEVQQKRRKKFKKGDAPPERSKMTMADLIYWNPAKTEEPQKSANTVNETASINLITEEDNIDDDDDDVENENNILDSVPKLVISEDGQINIDQSSLFVSRNVPKPLSTAVVRKDDTTYSSFRKRPLTKHWTDKDTANFYRALGLVGADFSLMEQIFPNRTRRELKQKFKREEKFNIDLINKVLYESQTFDELTLNDFIEDQNSAIDDSVLLNENDSEDAVKEKSRKKRTSKKKSTDAVTSDSFVDHLIEESAAENEKPDNKKSKKKKAKKMSDDEDLGLLIGGFINDNEDAAENKRSNNKSKKRKAKKMSHDEDLEMLLRLAVNNEDIDERKSSKRKRSVKKLPDDFIDFDSIQELEIWNDDESNNQDEFEKTNSSESQGNDENAVMENDNNAVIENDENAVIENYDNAIIENYVNAVIENEDNAVIENIVEEIIPESACVILDKIMNGGENTDNQQNLKEETCNATGTLPVATNENEEYISVEYIKNDDSNTDLCMLQTVVAYEVVNTQIAVPKRRRKINTISPLKARDYFLATKITPTNYTNYTPV